MGKRKSQAPKQMYKVELYIESPASLVPPDQWDWESMVNYNKDTPVRFVTCMEVQEGQA